MTTSTRPAGNSIDQSDEHLPKLLGIELDSVTAESVVARLAIRRELLAPNGYLHAATLIALADTACGYGTLAGVADAGASFTTLEVKTNFLATARDGTLRCHARRRHAGATTQVWDAEVTSDDRVLALFRCTQLILRPRPTSPNARRTTRAGDLTGDLPRRDAKSTGGTVIDARPLRRTGTPDPNPHPEATQ